MNAGPESLARSAAARYPMLQGQQTDAFLLGTTLTPTLSPRGEGVMQALRSQSPAFLPLPQGEGWGEGIYPSQRWSPDQVDGVLCAAK